MSKKCIQCGQEWPNEFNLCPVCGGKLETLKDSSSLIDIGDGNAINGGVHVDNSQEDDHSQKDDHSIADSNNTSNSHNITTTTTNQHIYNGNYTHIEREKTEQELQHEKELKYRECCKKVLADGLTTIEEHEWLDDQRTILGLTQEQAHRIFKEVSNNHQRQLMNMGTVQRIQFNNFKKAVEGNMVTNIKKFLPQIKVIANKFQEDELQYFFHMVLAALEPEECIKTYQERKGDSYWSTFWVAVALHKVGDLINAENALIDLGKWQGLMPDENTIILGALEYLMDGNKEEASDLYLQAVSSECSPLLDTLSSVIAALLKYDSTDQAINDSIIKNKFYLDHFLRVAYETEVKNDLLAKQEQQKREEERIQKELEEKQRQEEAERKRLEEEERKRRLEEEERKRKLEEEERKRRLEEEERKRKLEEEERKRRLEEEERKRQIEEEERKRQIEEEERKRQIEEEERKRKEEERRKENEEAERLMRQKQEEDRLRLEAEQIKNQVKFCRKCGAPIRVGARFCNKCGNKI